jgi:hypothetical protein
MRNRSRYRALQSSSAGPRRGDADEEGRVLLVGPPVEALTEAARRRIGLREAMRQSVQKAASYYNEAERAQGRAARLGGFDRALLKVAGRQLLRFASPRAWVEPRIDFTTPAQREVRKAWEPKVAGRQLFLGRGDDLRNGDSQEGANRIQR